MSVKDTAIKAFFKTKTYLGKYSPTILTVGGIVCGVAATATAIKETMKIDKIREDKLEAIEKINHAKHVAKEYPEDVSYTENNAEADKQIVQAKVYVAYVKLYAPTIILTAMSVTSILSAHHILSKRYAGVAAALVATAKKFNDYRGHVVEEYGEQKDKDFMNSVSTETKKDEKGKKIVTKKQKVFVDNDFDVYFDEFSPFWDKENPDMNVANLRTAMMMLNNHLKVRGNVFLNEVYDELGIDRTPAGAVVGWVINKEHPDTSIDFGVFNETDDPWDFNNDTMWDGKMGILLHFNPTDIIYDKI